MSEISQYTKRLRCRDPTLKWMFVINKYHTDAELTELADCLLTHLDVVTYVNLSYNGLTDETGVKLGRYVAASPIIQTVNLFHNHFRDATYLVLAAALRVNSSLQELYLHKNLPRDRTLIDMAFIEALRLNPVRPDWSVWWLYSPGRFSDVDFKRLKDAADKSVPPSMLDFLLCVHLDTEKIKTKIH
jgi:hypothetical protein